MDETAGVRPRVRVVAALIDDGARPLRFLVQQRSAHKARGGLWELPGGKVEPGEDDSEALKREGREELGVTLEVGPTVWETTHGYDDLEVRLVVMRARLDPEATTSPVAREAARLRWATPQELLALPFCEADLPLLEALASGALDFKRGSP